VKKIKMPKEKRQGPWIKNIRTSRGGVRNRIDKGGFEKNLSKLLTRWRLQRNFCESWTAAEATHLLMKELAGEGQGEAIKTKHLHG